MAEEPQRERPSRAEFDEAFRPIAAEIGFLARAWNGLHTNLGMIFTVLLSPTNINLPLAVWNKAPNDRAQRDMLRAPLQSWRRANPSKSKLVDEIEWLLIECETLSEKRNNALHSPLNIHMNTETFEFSVEPNWFRNHPRALKLKGKDVFGEFSRYRAQAERLDQYAMAIWMHLKSVPGMPLLRRPKSPTSGLTQNPLKQPRPKRPP